MEQLSPATAINDLLWLQKRLSGLSDLIPKLQEVSSLEAYSAELSRTIEDKNAELQSVLTKVENANNEVSNASKLVASAEATARANADLILAKAQSDASAMLVEARDEISKELAVLAAQKRKKLLEIDDLTAKTDALSASIVEQEVVFNELTAAIAELKARF